MVGIEKKEMIFPSKEQEQEGGKTEAEGR